MERGSRKESWFSERNCSAIALILGNACFSTACQRWFRVWHSADVNQCCSFAAVDLCYLKIWPCIFFCVRVCQRMIFFTTSLSLETETIGGFCMWKQQTVLPRTLRHNCSVKNPHDEWWSCGLFVNFVLPGKGDTHLEMNLLPKAWIWCLLCWENAAAWAAAGLRSMAMI